MLHRRDLHPQGSDVAAGFGKQVSGPGTMRQAVEAQVLTSHCALGEHGLRQILSDVIEEVRHSIHKDIDGAEVLTSLLSAPWLHSLLKVYECLQRFKLEQPTSYLNYASGLSLQLVLDIRSLPGSSEEARELCRLLRQPHFQALLSAHDTVAQRDYDPVLPPMPEELPEHEEATRVVCLVKNKQPLRCENQGLGLPPVPDSSLLHAPKMSLGGIRSQWATLKRLTHQRLSRGGGAADKGGGAATGQEVKEPSRATARRGSLPSTERFRGPPPPVPPYTPPPRSRYKPMSNCRVCFRNPVSPCRSCYVNSLWGKNHSSPSGSGSVLMDDVTDELDSPSGSARTYCTLSDCSPTYHRPRWTTSPLPHRSAAGSYSNAAADDHRLRIGVPWSHSLCVRTAPPSPMTPRHQRHLCCRGASHFPRGGGGGPCAPVELAKQESLDELRTTVQLAAGSMHCSTRDIEQLGEKMAAAAERASEGARENARALALLAQVVDRLQTLLELTTATARTEEEAEESGVPAETPGTDRDARDSQATRSQGSRTHPERCLSVSCQTLPSTPPSSPSRRGSPCTSRGRGAAGSLRAFSRGSKANEAATLDSPAGCVRVLSNGPHLPNGLSERGGSAGCPVATGGLATSAQRRKKKKKKAT